MAKNIGNIKHLFNKEEIENARDMITFIPNSEHIWHILDDIIIDIERTQDD